MSVSLPNLAKYYRDGEKRKHLTSIEIADTKAVHIVGLSNLHTNYMGKEQTMSRWIDGEWLLNFFEPYPNDYQTPLGSLRACVDDAPSIDIVWCSECRYSNGVGEYCQNDCFVKEDTFCSYGKRSRQ